MESACARRLCLCCVAVGQEIVYFPPFPSSCLMNPPPRTVFSRAKRDDCTAHQLDRRGVVKTHAQSSRYTMYAGKSHQIIPSCIQDRSESVLITLGRMKKAY